MRFRTSSLLTSIEANLSSSFSFSDLSYSNFTYDSISLSGQNVTADADIIVSVQVTNVGEVDGHEVVQVYYTDVYSS